MRAVLIDDEKYCTDVLRILLNKHVPKVQIVEIFNDPLEALEYLKAHPTDLIFLDIEMPLLNGIELLRKLGPSRSKIIFTTAYNDYAIKAFKFNTIDYLLKPIDKNELMEAVSKATNWATEVMIDNLEHISSSKSPTKILLPIGNELLFIKTENIICCEADGSYTKIYTLQYDKPILLSKTLKVVEEKINNNQFLRCHTSWLINENFIEKIIKGDSMEIGLANNMKIPVSRNKRQEVVDRLSQ